MQLQKVGLWPLAFWEFLLTIVNLTVFWSGCKAFQKLFKLQNESEIILLVFCKWKC